MEMMDMASRSHDSDADVLTIPANTVPTDSTHLKAGEQPPSVKSVASQSSVQVERGHSVHISVNNDHHARAAPKQMSVPIPRPPVPNPNYANNQQQPMDTIPVNPNMAMIIQYQQQQRAQQQQIEMQRQIMRNADELLFALAPEPVPVSLSGSVSSLLMVPSLPFGSAAPVMGEAEGGAVGSPTMTI